MLAAPHLPLAVIRDGAPPTGRVVLRRGPSTSWLRAPEHAATLGDARAIGENAEAARVLGQHFRERFSRVAVVARAEAPAIRWMASSLPVIVLDPRRPSDRRLVEGEGLGLLAVALDDPDPVLTEIQATGIDDRSRWIALARKGSSLWTTSARWAGRLALPDWITPSGLATSPLGLLLAEWSGVDSVRLSAGAREVDNWCAEPEPTLNPASWLARDLRRPVALFVERAALAPLALWAASAAAERGRVITLGEPAPHYAFWSLVGPDGAAPGAGGLEIRVDPEDPAAWGAWCALVERALDQADELGPPPWYGRAAEVL